MSGDEIPVPPDPDEAGRDADDPAAASGPLGRAAALAKNAASGAVGYVADRRYERTPAGKARKAARRGAATFHIRLDLDEIAYRSGGRSTDDPAVDDAIGQIEAEGWRLDNLEYITETDEYERTDPDEVVERGTVQRTSAVLLFRRVDE